MFVTYPLCIREKARQMRARQMTLDEIAERLALPKTTVWHWIKDIPVAIPRTTANSPKRAAAQAKGVASMQAKFARIRDEAYRTGMTEFDELSSHETFRDFVAIYIGEGYKRSRNTVSVANSDPRVIQLADRWIRLYASNPVTYQCQHHADQDPAELARFWAAVLGTDPSRIKMFQKSNSGQLAGRTWRCRHGVVAVTSNDTRFRARIQGWIDRMQRSWIELPTAEDTPERRR